MEFSIYLVSNNCFKSKCNSVRILLECCAFFTKNVLKVGKNMKHLFFYSDQLGSNVVLCLFLVMFL